MSDIEDKIKADLSRVYSAEKSATGWVKSHVAWMIGLVAFVVGAFLGHALS